MSGDNYVFGDARSPRVDEPDGPHTIVGDDSATAMGLWKGLLFHLQELVENIGEPAETMATGQVVLAVTSKEVLAANPSRRFAEVKNADGSISIYIGMDSGVSSANGHLLKTGESIGFEDYIGPIWAIAASGTPTITAIEW